MTTADITGVASDDLVARPGRLRPSAHREDDLRLPTGTARHWHVLDNDVPRSALTATSKGTA
jgi:hypothetical protein